MKFRIALLAASVFAAPFAVAQHAMAQPVTGPYVSGGAGFNDEVKQKAKDFTFDGAGVPGTARISLYGGYTGEASIGYGFGNGLRVEVEGDYYNNRFKNVGSDFGNLTSGFKASGYEQKYGGFVNAIYDFDIGLPWMYPYVGGGVGWQNSEFTGFDGVVDGSTGNLTKTRGALAYQGIAGVSFPIPPVPGLSITIDYRFMGLAGSRKYRGSIDGVPASFKVLHEYNNAVLGGVRYAFDTAPPPAPTPTPAPAPAAAPAPAPAKTYLVFFDWDKYDLTPRAVDIIAQAASDSHTQQTTVIDVSGYTDTSGTPNYNQGLSQRRAQSVAAQLVTDGVAQSEITIHAYGETHLLVQTGPGVREPQNRRVEIVLQ